VNAGGIVLGAALLVVGFVLIRYRRAFAEWQIDNRIEQLRRSSLLNAEYVEREIDALRKPDSHRLSGWSAALGGVFAIVCGVVALVHSLGHG
jgi:uncharacterized membrane protein HdeD (DUF308 family)